jgi:hypothetical protein
MSIADKFEVIADAVYEKGMEAERRAFWDVFQDKGNRSSYPYAFYRWDEDIYNPIYDIVTDDATYLYSYSTITDTRVNITVTAATIGAMFYMATKLKTIKNIIFTSDTNFTTPTFNQAISLENITMSGEGKIVGSFSMQYSKLLTADSIKSIIEQLKITTGTDMEGEYKMTLSSECWQRIEATPPPTGYESWKEYVILNKGWNV